MRRTLADWIASADRARDRRSWDWAARRYRRALVLAPERDDLWIQYGHALKESGRLDAAQASYETALGLADGVADSWMQLGHLLALRGRIDAAADAYCRAVIRDPKLVDAARALRALLTRGARADEALRAAAAQALRPRPRHGRLLTADAAGIGARFEAALARLDDRADPARVEAVRAGMAALTGLAPPDPTGPMAVFDVSDLIGYFAHSRLPTGIQRVQIEVLSALLTDPVTESRVRVCAFHEGRDDWVGLPSDLLLDLADAALAGGDLTDPDWRGLLDALDAERTLGPDFAFPTGAWLINLGTSWWLQNYFLKVREARRRFGVRYVPFVHDMIPVMAPEHCVKPLVRDFVSWALGVFAHADGFLTNSEASRADLVAVAGRLGVTIPPERIRVVRLDADFRKPGLGTGDGILARNGLTPGSFMLFVSTIESRKNHVEAFAALSALLRRHDPATVPKLVCVGGRGWLNDAVFARLRSDPVLARHVVMLSGVPDPELDALYRACRFTLYPSLYEGWGLPVTESLCHGKVPLASTRSSVPEAGGDLAVYAAPGDLEGLTEAMSRLAFDDVWRAHLECRIRERFRPRGWADLGRDMLDAVDAWAAEEGVVEAAVPLAVPGRLHRLARSTALGIGPDSVSDEAFRQGLGWAAPEDWGCRARGAGADLAFRLHLPAGAPIRLHLALKGLERSLAVLVARPDRPPTTVHLLPGVIRWLVLDDAAPGPDGAVRLRLSARPAEAARPTHDRIDLGVVGFMVCAADDLAARADFQAAIATGGWETRPPEDSFD